MNIIKGGVTAAKGFKAAGCEAQIKYKNAKYLQLLLNGTETLYIMKTLHRL